MENIMYMSFGRELKTISNYANSFFNQEGTVKTGSQFRTLLVCDGNCWAVIKAKLGPFPHLKVDLTVMFIIMLLHVILSSK